MRKRAHESLARQSSVTWDAAIALRTGWSRWASRSTHRQVVAASIVLLSLSIVCKAAAAGREVATAYWFGTGEALDAFVVAFTIPTFAIVAIANSAGAALLPAFTQVRQRDGYASAVRLLRESTFWCLLLLIGATAIMAVASSWLLGLVSPGFDAHQRSLTQQLMLWLVPAIVFRGLVSLWSAVLHSQERFAVTGLAPALTPLAVIICMFAMADAWGIQTLAIGVVIGSIAEAIVIAWFVVSSGYSLLPRPARLSPRMVQVAQQYVPLVVAAALMGSTTLIDNAMASQLGTGSVSTLNYGRKLVALAISIPTLSISKAIFPYFTKLIAARKWADLHDTLARSRFLILGVMIPMTLALILFSRPLTAMVLQHGAFDASSTGSVSWVQIMYAFQIPFYALGIIYVRLISSLRMNQLLTISTMISILLNVVLNYVLMQPMGVAGIALSTSLVYAVACGFLMFVTHRALRSAAMENSP